MFEVFLDNILKASIFKALRDELFHLQLKIGQLSKSFGVLFITSD